jgi:dipeptidase
MKHLILVLLCVYSVFSCTNFLITKGASVEGNNLITYNADSHALYGALYHFPAADHPNNSVVDIVDWDSQVYLGKIPQVPHTYNVVGNMNEFALAIGETTYGGREELNGHSGMIDYGSLIYITLQRARNAREAIKVMGDLVTKYGYYSEGESFSIGDTNEVWMLEMIGKGNGEFGAVWVAQRIPDGFVSAHANQARITTFDCSNTENFACSHDVISFAKRKGFYPNNAPDAHFSFSDVYDSVTVGGARFCEARVWSFFNKICDGMDKYLNYAQGYNLTNRLPLYVKPRSKISLNDTFNYMRDAYQGTWFEMRYDVGAESYQRPVRWSPLIWKVNSNTYCNERPISTQQTGWSFVAQLRPNLPPSIGGILWFGIDDSALAVHVPFYAGMKRIPKSYEDGELMVFSFDSAFWVFNMVNNFVYTRYTLMFPEVFKNIVDVENRYFSDVKKIDEEALNLIKQGQLDKALNYVTDTCVFMGDSLVASWLDLWKSLFTKYLDGDIRTRNPQSKIPKIVYPGYTEGWYKKIVSETGDHYKLPLKLSASDPKLRNKKIF